MGGQHFHYDAWLSHILNRDVYQAVILSSLFEIEAERQTLDSAIEEYLVKTPVFLYAKTAADDLEGAHYLESHGFNFIETSLLFEKPVHRRSLSQTEYEVRFSTSKDARQTVELARNNFVFSRFHMDSRFSKETAHHLKAEWVNNYFCGKRGDQMVVAYAGGRVVGFLLLIFGAGSSLLIDLIAVDRHFRRRGVAGSMIAFAEANLPAFQSIHVGTQAVNIPSVRLYENLGFRIRGAQYIFHCHH